MRPLLLLALATFTLSTPAYAWRYWYGSTGSFGSVITVGCDDGGTYVCSTTATLPATFDVGNAAAAACCEANGTGYVDGGWEIDPGLTLTITSKGTVNLDSVEAQSDSFSSFGDICDVSASSARTVDNSDSVCALTDGLLMECCGSTHLRKGEECATCADDTQSCSSASSDGLRFYLTRSSLRK